MLVVAVVDTPVADLHLAVAAAAVMEEDRHTAQIFVKD